jgi:hypothetical protein
VKLIVNLQGVFLHLQILIIEDVLSIIVVGLILELNEKAFMQTTFFLYLEIYEILQHILSQLYLHLDFANLLNKFNSNILTLLSTIFVLIIIQVSLLACWHIQWVGFAFLQIYFHLQKTELLTLNCIGKKTSHFYFPSNHLMYIMYKCVYSIFT